MVTMTVRSLPFTVVATVKLGSHALVSCSSYIYIDVAVRNEVMKKRISCLL